jgi:hypothetical protein
MHRSHPIHLTHTAVAPAEALDELGSLSRRAHTDAGIWPAVPAFELPERLTEVDARSLAGHAGTVTLYLSVGAAAHQYVVHVESAAGETLARITTETRVEALDAYRHPFARPDVPDIFSRAES